MNDKNSAFRLSWWKVALLVSVLAVVGLVLVASRFGDLNERSREELQSRLAELRARGEPVYPEDMAFDLAEGESDATSWLRSFETLPENWRELELFDESPQPVARARELASLAHDTKGLEILDAWEACRRDSSWTPTFRDREGAWAFLNSQPSMEQVEPCDLLALQVIGEVTGPCYERAREVSRGARYGWATESTSGDYASMQEFGAFQEYPAMAYIRMVRSLSISASIRTLRGDFEGGREDLLLCLRAARLMEDQPMLVGHHLFGVALTEHLRSLEHCLPRFPRDFDLSEIEEQLIEIDPRRLVIQAIQGERVHFNHMFRGLRGELPGKGSHGGRRHSARELSIERVASSLLPKEYLVNQQQLLLLDLVDEVLHLCGETPFEASLATDRRVEELIESRWDGEAMLGLFARPSDYQESILHQEVIRDLALVALMAHRTSVELALEHLRSLEDPFSGRGYEGQIGKDGSLVMSSVGRDGVSKRAGRAGTANEDMRWTYPKLGETPMPEAVVSQVRVHEGWQAPALITSFDLQGKPAWGVAVGGAQEQGPACLLRSEDAGRSWQAIDHEHSARLYDVVTRPNGEAFVVGLGGAILRSRDHGKSFEAVRQGDEWLSGIAFADDSNAWVVGASDEGALVLRSRDGGATWQEVDVVPAGYAKASLRCIEFRDSKLGVLAGTDGALLLTTDGGESWRALPASTGYLRGIAFGSDHFWVVGAPGVVLRVADDGASWKKQPFPVEAKLNSIALRDDSSLFVTTMDGQLYESSDAGHRWQVLHDTQGRHLTKVRAPRDGKPGLVVGDRGAMLRLEWLP